MAAESRQADEQVAVVVVTYSSGDSLATFLDTVTTASRRRLDIVVADNGSTDDAPEQAARRSGVRLLTTGGNLGYGRAANAGVAETDAEWVVIANPDVVWNRGAVDELLAAAQRWPRSGSLGPLIRTAEGSVYPSARELPSLSRGIGHALFGWWWPTNPWTAAYRQERSEPTERVAGWLSGSCLLIRRVAFDSVGGFDPGYFMYFEDVDLGDRLGRAGWLNVYVPTAQVTHVGAHATAQHAKQMLLEHHRSAYRYLSSRYRGPIWAPLRLLLRVGLSVRATITPRAQRFSDRHTAARQPDATGRVRP